MAKAVNMKKPEAQWTCNLPFLTPVSRVAVLTVRNSDPMIPKIMGIYG